MLTRMWKLMRSLQLEVAPAFEGMGLAHNDHWLLATVDQHPYPTEIVNATKFPAPTVSQMLKRLETLGLVKRSLDPNDLRRYRFDLTEQGRQTNELGRQLMEKAIGKRLSRLEAHEQQELIWLLDRMIAEPLPAKE
ncbi:homoprotocatechuate degradation operon regulator, HpaR [Meiothermus granaticius NBRC 107808]|uniref:Homoprotocatechuate degradation operon regulator, HpaR n=1 Tax=Meiothermus granaticius NBRC 107808 TaxID=1227551 RepID=A0A399F8W2_9DEIN|nr:homoprotocatechuate degradation operon regulator, HpaR [Meiothermus granaticius NBRC 107808]